ncbi:MAG: J domain-containing protein, partial [Oscillospiraceae bacterium]|nr:J domain-containing protein [Oscillospiraceae bacterium]
MWKILGIAPTRDIKEIKKAYARLAKQYNPEEKPEEFKRIFEAYKAACIYAKSTEIHFSQNEHNENEDDKTKLILISRSEDHTMTNADENKDTSSDEAADTAQEYDFSTVDVRKNTGRNKTDEIKDTSSDEAADTAQGYDFSVVNVRKNTGRNESVSEEKFDFGSIDPHFSELNGTDRTSNLRIYLIRRLKKIFDSRKEADINTWQSFFYDTYFDELVFDVDFRLQARDVFFQRHLPLLTAKLVAEKFGAGTQYVDEGYGRYTVIISDGRNNYYSHAVNNTVY